MALQTTELAATPIVAILGAGRMSQMVATLLCGGERRVWGRQRPAPWPAAFAQVRWCDSIAQACTDAAVVVITVPIQAMRAVVREFGEVARGDQVVLFLARGVEANFVLPHSILRDESCVRKIGVLGGPLQTLAAQAAQPIAVVVGSHYADPAQWVRQLAASRHVLVYPSRDLVGVEVAAAIGNVTSMAVGMAEALQLGDTVRGLLLTRGLAEAARVGRTLGGLPQTFASLAGLGALIPHSSSLPGSWLDRHILLGQALAQAPLAVTFAAVCHSIAGGTELDGPQTAAAAVALSQVQQFELPQVLAVHQVVQRQCTAAVALQQVLQRGLDFGAEFTASEAPPMHPERWL